MASGVNKVILVGNVGVDPEVKYTQAGNAVCNLRLAVSERRKGKDGNYGEHTEWVTVVCFGRTAENVGQFVSKGRQIYIEGRMQTRKWTDREGSEKWNTEVVADNVVFLRGGETGVAQKTGGKEKAGGDDPGFYDDDLPF